MEKWVVVKKWNKSIFLFLLVSNLAWNEGKKESARRKCRVEFRLLQCEIGIMAMFQSWIAIRPMLLVSLWRQERHLSLSANSSCYTQLWSILFIYETSLSTHAAWLSSLEPLKKNNNKIKNLPINKWTS